MRVKLPKPGWVLVWTGRQRRRRHASCSHLFACIGIFRPGDTIAVSNSFMHVLCTKTIQVAGPVPPEGSIMSARNRVQWDRHVDQVVRSQHYTWLGERLAGRPLPQAATHTLFDIIQLCARHGMSV